MNQHPNPPKAASQPARMPGQGNARDLRPRLPVRQEVARHAPGGLAPVPALPKAPDLGDPIRQFTSRRLTRKENLLKRQIDTYHVSEVDNSAIIYFDRKAFPVRQSVDLPDAMCEGLCFKQRLVQTRNGDLLLLVRWKPDRYMRRSAPEGSQRWFVEKQLFPPDVGRFFSRMEKQAVDSAETAAAAEEAE